MLTSQEEQPPVLDGKKKYKDYNTEELMQIFGCVEVKLPIPAPNPNMKPLEYAKDLLLALIPSSDLIADLAAAQNGIGQIESNKVLSNIKEGIKDSVYLDRVTLAHSHNRRPSRTAKRCTVIDCEIFHYSFGSTCQMHREKPASAHMDADIAEVKSILETDLMLTTPITGRVQSKNLTKDTIANIQAEILRKQSQIRSEIFDDAISPEIFQDVESFMTEHSDIVALGMHKLELAQLYLQFKRLDVNKDGFIDGADILVLISKVDPTWASSFTEQESLLVKCQDILSDAIPGCARLSFEGYVISLMKLRQQHESVTCSKELLRSMFWDLRSCVVFTPNRPLQGWLVKRGYLFAREYLNTWKRRYFRVHETTNADGLFEHVLEYWDGDIAAYEADIADAAAAGAVNETTANAAQSGGDVSESAASVSEDCQRPTAIGADSVISQSETVVVHQDPISASKKQREKFKTNLQQRKAHGDAADLAESPEDDSEEQGCRQVDSTGGRSTEEDTTSLDTGELLSVSSELTCYQLPNEDELESSASMSPTAVANKPVNGPEGPAVTTAPTAPAVTKVKAAPIKKGTIQLLDIVFIDFSPLIKVKQTKELTAAGVVASDQICMLISTGCGRKYTLAGDYDSVLKWAAELSWYMSACRLIKEWRQNWGTQRMNVISIRDWINAGAVIAKLGMQKQMKSEINAKGVGVGRHKAQLLNEFKEYQLTDRDHEALEICHLSKQTVETAGGTVLMAIKVWNTQKYTLKHFDKAYLYGAVGYTASGISNSIRLWKFAKTTTNKYNCNKYGVNWQSSSEERHCAVCKHIFKAFARRATGRKHHCRSCGRVVCDACSSHRIYILHCKSFERACTECVINNGPLQDDFLVGFDGGKHARDELTSAAMDSATSLVPTEIMEKVDQCQEAVEKNRKTVDKVKKVLGIKDHNEEGEDEQAEEGEEDDDDEDDKDDKDDEDEQNKLDTIEGSQSDVGQEESHQSTSSSSNAPAADVEDVTVQSLSIDDTTAAKKKPRVRKNKKDKKTVAQKDEEEQVENESVDVPDSSSSAAPQQSERDDADEKEEEENVGTTSASASSTAVSGTNDSLSRADKAAARKAARAKTQQVLANARAIGQAARTRRQGRQQQPQDDTVTLTVIDSVAK